MTDRENRCVTLKLDHSVTNVGSNRWNFRVPSELNNIYRNMFNMFGSVSRNKINVEVTVESCARDRKFRKHASKMCRQ